MLLMSDDYRFSRLVDSGYRFGYYLDGQALNWY